MSLTNDAAWRVPPAEVYRFVMILGRKEKILERTELHLKDAAQLTPKNLKRWEERRLVKQMKRAFRTEERSIGSRTGSGISGIGGNDKVLGSGAWRGYLVESAFRQSQQKEIRGQEVSLNCSRKRRSCRCQLMQAGGDSPLCGSRQTRECASLQSSSLAVIAPRNSS